MSTPLWLIYCDGTCKPNPGAMAVGALVIDPDGTRHTLSRLVGRSGCNTEAEAEALIYALSLAKQLGANAVRAYSDSVVLIEQTTGRTRTEVARLAVVFAAARTALAHFEVAELKWLMREKNIEADGLARAALGLPPRPPKNHAKRTRS